MSAYRPFGSVGFASSLAPTAAAPSPAAGAATTATTDTPATAAVLPVAPAAYRPPAVTIPISATLGALQIHSPITLGAASATVIDNSSSSRRAPAPAHPRVSPGPSQPPSVNLNTTPSSANTYANTIAVTNANTNATNTNVNTKPYSFAPATQPAYTPTKSVNLLPALHRSAAQPSSIRPSPLPFPSPAPVPVTPTTAASAALPPAGATAPLPTSRAPSPSPVQQRYDPFARPGSDVAAAVAPAAFGAGGGSNSGIGTPPSPSRGAALQSGRQEEGEELRPAASAPASAAGAAGTGAAAGAASTGAAPGASTGAEGVGFRVVPRMLSYNPPSMGLASAAAVRTVAAVGAVRPLSVPSSRGQSNDGTAAGLPPPPAPPPTVEVARPAPASYNPLMLLLLQQKQEQKEQQQQKQHEPLQPQPLEACAPPAAGSSRSSTPPPSTRAPPSGTSTGAVAMAAGSATAVTAASVPPPAHQLPMPVALLRPPMPVQASTAAAAAAIAAIAPVTAPALPVPLAHLSALVPAPALGPVPVVVRSSRLADAPAAAAAAGLGGVDGGRGGDGRAAQRREDAVHLYEMVGGQCDFATCEDVLAQVGGDMEHAAQVLLDMYGWVGGGGGRSGGSSSSDDGGGGGGGGGSSGVGAGGSSCGAGAFGKGAVDSCVAEGFLAGEDAGAAGEAVEGFGGPVDFGTGAGAGAEAAVGSCMEEEGGDGVGGGGGMSEQTAAALRAAGLPCDDGGLAALMQQQEELLHAQEERQRRLREETEQLQREVAARAEAGDGSSGGSRGGGGGEEEEEDSELAAALAASCRVGDDDGWGGGGGGGSGTAKGADGWEESCAAKADPWASSCAGGGFGGDGSSGHAGGAGDGMSAAEADGIFSNRTDSPRVGAAAGAETAFGEAHAGWADMDESELPPEEDEEDSLAGKLDEIRIYFPDTAEDVILMALALHHGNKEKALAELGGIYKIEAQAEADARFARQLAEEDEQEDLGAASTSVEEDYMLNAVEGIAEQAERLAAIRDEQRAARKAAAAAAAGSASRGGRGLSVGGADGRSGKELLGIKLLVQHFPGADEGLLADTLSTHSGAVEAAAAALRSMGLVEAPQPSPPPSPPRPAPFRPPPLFKPVPQTQQQAQTQQQQQRQAFRPAVSQQQHRQRYSDAEEEEEDAAPLASRRAGGGGRGLAAEVATGGRRSFSGAPSGSGAAAGMGQRPGTGSGYFPSQTQGGLASNAATLGPGRYGNAAAAQQLQQSSAAAALGRLAHLVAAGSRGMAPAPAPAAAAAGSSHGYYGGDYEAAGDGSGPSTSAPTFQVKPLNALASLGIDFRDMGFSDECKECLRTAFMASPLCDMFSRTGEDSLQGHLDRHQSALSRAGGLTHEEKQVVWSKNREVPLALMAMCRMLRQGSRASFVAGHKNLARELKEAADALQPAIHEHHRMAASKIYGDINAGLQQQWKTDLHALLPKEVGGKLDEQLGKLANMGGNVDWLIITGRGAHSPNGPKVSRAVAEWMEGHGLRWESQQDGGAVRVQLTPEVFERLAAV